MYVLNNVWVNVLLDFNWKVLPGLHGNDHFIILLAAEGEPRTRLPRWHIDRADWKPFTHLTSSVRGRLFGVLVWPVRY